MIRTINEISDIRGKYVLLRDDFNVQIRDGKVIDTFRIAQSLPTIIKLKDAGARIVIICHLGRPTHPQPTLCSAAGPGDARNEKYTTRPIADTLSEFLKTPVKFHDDCLNPPLDNMNDGDVMLLENVRFYAGEEQNDDEFAKKLAHGFDIFINDAFAVSHRAHASTVGVTKYLPSFAGLLLESEIKELNHVMTNPARPLVGLVSGAKIKSKIGIIYALGKFCDKIICAGGIGTSIHVAMGMKNIVMDEANLEKNHNDDDTREKILEIMRQFGDKIILPVDKGVAPEFARDAPRTNKLMADIIPGDVVMDERPESIKEYTAAIDNAKTFIWNGPVGMAEWTPNWSFGTYAMARHVAARTRAGKLESIVGGGDTVAALNATDTEKDITYVSTGGGAFLEFIEGKTLPGIAALQK